MRLSALFVSIFFISVVSAAVKTVTSKTSVWATGTNADGVTTVTESVFTQTFMKTYTETTGSPSKGSAGLGTLTGEVGRIRSYTRHTVSTNGGSPSKFTGNNHMGKTPMHFIGILGTAVSGALLIAFIV